jgi:hypothetical protein
MAEGQKGPGDVPTGQRMKHVGAEMAKSLGHQLLGKEEREQKGAAYTLDEQEITALIEEWPKGQRDTARRIMERYGAPNEGSPVRLTWYGKGPWKRIEITRDQIAHNFPAPHTDYITCWIDYHVPVERFSDLARYDGSCLLDRTAGEAGARCDSEAANFVMLNLMHEIVTRKRTVDDARQKYAEQMGRPAPPSL